MSFAPGWRGTNNINQEMQMRIGENSCAPGGDPLPSDEEQLTQFFKQFKNKTMSVKAKFLVASITNHYSGTNLNGSNVVLQPVINGSEENKTWSKYTPSGKVELFITNPDAVKQFEEGGEFYVTFEKAD